MMTQNWVNIGLDNGFVAWQHKAITWINVDVSIIKSSDIRLRAISQEIHQASINKINLKKKFIQTSQGPMS